jgi:hypothetical protein
VTDQAHHSNVLHSELTQMRCKRLCAALNARPAGCNILQRRVTHPAVSSCWQLHSFFCAAQQSLHVVCCIRGCLTPQHIACMTFRVLSEYCADPVEAVAVRGTCCFGIRPAAVTVQLHGILCGPVVRLWFVEMPRDLRAQDFCVMVRRLCQALCVCSSCYCCYVGAGSIS